MNLTDINLDSLSPEEQRALLAQLLADEAPVETSFPLSFNQQRLWFLDQLDGGAIYNLPIVLQIEGTLNVAYLTQALNEIVRRHAVLRTVYQEVDGQPQQVISADATISLPVVNLQHLPLAEQEVAIRRLSEEEAQRPFNLTQDIMLRGQLLQQSSHKHVLLLTMHHIASDGWSVRILTRELRTLYAAFVDQQPSPLPEPPIQYVDFAHWQREWLQGDVLENLLNYWKTQLADAPKVLELPHDRPRPAVQSYDGARYRFELDNELTAKLNKLAQKQGASLFMVLLSGFNVLLARYSRQTDIVVGTAVANRNRAEIEGLIGFFVNTLALRTQFNDNPSFVELLDRVRENTLAAYQHQELPFEQLVDALQLERTLSYTPIFQVMLSLQNTKNGEKPAAATANGASLTTLPRPFDLTFAKFDLTLLMTESDEGLSGAFKYNTDLFDHSTIVRISTHFANLLQHIVEQPLTPVLQLPLSTQAEYRQIAYEWNDTTASAGVDFHNPQKTVVQLFEEQVAQTPDTAALVFEETTLTYRALNERANLVAHRLLELGIKPEDPVGLLIERSAELIIGLLGILKAGGCYLPLNPTDPPERKQTVLQEARATMLLTDWMTHPTAQFTGVKTLCVNGVQHEPALVKNPSLQAGLHNLAYILFTSGSTGRPKGVAVEHRQLAHYMWAMLAQLALPAQATYAGVQSLTFDSVVTILYPALCRGGTVHLISEEVRANPVLYAAYCAKNPIDILKITPSHLKILLNEAGSSVLPQQRLIVGGEASSWEFAAQLLATMPAGCRLFNHYGPTEATVGVSAYEVKRGNRAGSQVPIGRPFAGTTLYVLDEFRTPTPMGVMGELYIGGKQVAREYIYRPTLTAEKFIEHPEFGRLYKTGDLCRWIPDGAGTPVIEYFGRTDFQVKIRGFRIELGEIENALLAQAGVREAVVIAREEGESKRLVAYVAGEAEIETLREALGKQLPEHMLPAAFVTLDEMPLTTSGKLDRHALPAPDYVDSQIAYVPPRNVVEAALAQTFADVLRLPHVGIHDSFFRMGGDSILTIQLVSRVAKQGYTISVKDVFLHPTVAELAAVANTAKPQMLASQEIQLGDSPLLPIQRAFLAMRQPQMHHYNQAFLLTVKRPFHPTQLEDAITVLLRHHDALRFQYVPEQSGWRQQYLAPSEHVPLTFVPLGVSPDEHAAHIEAIGTEAQTSLDPLSGDLVRFVYFKADQHDNDRLLIVIHHLAVDGVSWRILIEDLATLLDGGQLLPKTSSYRAWAEALREATENGRFDAEIGRWLAKSADTPLPLDEPTALDSMGNRHRLQLTLSESQTEQLLRTLPDLHDVSLDAVLLTALTETLADWSGQAALCIKFESHGRQALFDTINLNRTVGWFTATYPLTIPRFDGSPLKRLRYTLEQLRSVQEGGISFGVLRDFHPDAHIREQFAALPSPRVVYNYLGQLDNLNSEHFSRSQESAGASVSPHFVRDSLLESNARVVDKQLHISWTVTPQISRANAESLLATFEKRIETLLSAVLYSTERVAIPTDFSAADLSLSELEALQRAVDFANVETVMGLSPMQAGMLFHSQFAPQSGTYIEHKLFHVQDAAFEPRRFVAAIQQVIGRHDALRASFHADGRAVQVIHRQATLPTEFLDWQALSAPEQKERLAELIEQDRLTDFDLSHAPLLRFVVIQQGADNYALLLTSHHLLMDRWSGELFWSEVMQRYADQRLPKAVPYQSFIQHLRQQADSAEFWQTYLHGFTAPTPLPAATPISQNKGELVTLARELSVELTQQLTSLAREQGLTVNTLFQTAWAVLLSQYARESDVLFGMVTSGRTAPVRGIESIVGLLLNTLPLRVQLDDEMTVTALLQQVAQTQLEIQQREHASLVDVQRWSNVPAGTRLFDTLFLFQNTPKNSKHSTHLLNLQAERVNPGDTGYPLVAAAGVREAATLMLSGETAVYEVETIERLLTQWQQLLIAFVAQPEQRVAHLSLLTDAERHQIVHEWNNTAVDYGEPQTIHALFEAQAAATPDAVAVLFEDRQLTYAELNERANQLAHHLIELGVRPDTLVAIALERSVEMVVSLLAVLKAGGAYVPIDPTYPEGRIRTILADCSAEILLTHSHLDINGAEICRIDVDCLAVTQNTTNPQTATTPADLAYVIYTSGSTGRPKGVLVTHIALSRHIQSVIDEYGVTSADCVLQFASFSFDTSIEQLFVTLCRGAKLLLRGSDLWTTQELDRRLRQHQVTVCNLPPSYFHHLLAYWHANLGSVTSLPIRLMIIGGEKVPLNLVEQWQQLFAHSTCLLNAYGPTEAVITATTYDLSSYAVGRANNLPIGRPLPNRKSFILDSQQQPVPIGLPGELFMGGEQLARGYWNRPALTAERFIEHPEFGRLYKTGDLCRWLPDGNIEYIGRTDFQVKLRGFRIELGEIENVLLAQDGVRETAVIVHDDHLVAYVVGNAEDTTLRHQLAQLLPDYMVPAAFVTLDKLPLTPNGKLDRNALPTPNYADTQVQFVAPRTIGEQQVAQIWSNVLGIEQVGVYDDFFALGGHSLLAIQVISQLRARLNLEIPLKTLFEASQLANFAHAIAQTHETPTTAIQKANRAGQLPLSFAQQRLWFLEQLQPASAQYNMPALLRLQGKLDVTALEQSFTYLVQRHESLRTTFDVLDGEPIQVIHPPSPVSLAVVAVADEDEALRHGNHAVTTPFDLRQGPLLRLALFRIGEHDHLLALSMHHIISDGWSVGRFTKELATAYTSYSAGRVPALPELPIQYADFAIWQRSFLKDDVLAKQIGFWREQLQGALPLLELPTDRPRPAEQTIEGARHSFELGEELTAQLNQLAHSNNATLFMLLLSAFNVLLSRYSRQTDIVVGTPIANRNRAEIEGLIGFFVNTLALRTQLDHNQTFLALLESVRQTTLAAYEHQDLPFEQLVDALQLERSLSYSPLFQVLFVLQNPEMEQLRLPGLTVSRQPIETAVAKFDLTLNLVEKEGGLRGSIVYNTALFDTATIASMANYLTALLHNIVGNPNRPVTQLSMLDDAEYQKIVHAWNGTAASAAGDYGEPLTIHALFERQAVNAPDAVALVYEGEELTYGELNERANQLAHHLIALGAQPETLIAVMMERSLEMIIGLLAVLKAGAAYVPIDPTYPEDRIAYMLADSGVKIVLKQARLTIEQATIVHPIDVDKFEGAHFPTSNPTTKTTAVNLAYVIYTSGSTGRPKGVLIEHDGALTVAQAQIALLPGLTSGARILHQMTLGFDAATFEIMMALLHGVTLVIAPADHLRAGEPLAALLKEQRITHVTLVPSVAKTLGDVDLPDLQLLITAGEACSADLVNRWAHGRAFFNLYGPTESPIWTTYVQLEVGDRVHIGRPIPNRSVYILDAAESVTPVGIAGELCIGGRSLARGYLNRPELTAERFVEHPEFGRIYKTGDLCCWLPDGNIEFLGRTDSQVKIRGFRIELGEIENMLLTQDGVQETAVVVHGDTAQRLVAYFVGNAESNTLRQQVAQQLPEYMVPAAFVKLEKLPLTPNGKLDRRALPAPDMRGHLRSAYVAASSELQQTLVRVWQQELNLEQVGIHDNFFDLGGNSLLTLKVHSRLREIVDKPPALVDLFRYPTIHALCAYLEPTAEQKADAPVVRQRHVERDAIAIVGMAGRFPGADSIAALWHNLASGVEAVTHFSDDELLAAGVDPNMLADPAYVKSRAILSDIQHFDARFFGFSNREATLLDPQTRLFLECAWTALEDAGCDPQRYAGAIGVFAGSAANSYQANHLNPALANGSSANRFQIASLNGKHFLTTHVSYKLNLTGPSVVVQTACSTSLVATHQACQSLLNNECDMALAGGVSLRTPEHTGYLHQTGMIMSSDGHCRAFDIAADGTFGGDGVGIVALKRLQDAVDDGDRIYAVIKGSAINNDGANKVGYTAPSIDGQLAVIRQALANANVAPGTISYVETHGTGTKLGDPIELTALKEAFEGRRGQSDAEKIVLGAIKTNFGHLDTAAGVAGLIKTALALKHQAIPPTLHFTEPNPELNFPADLFEINTALKPWQKVNAEVARRAGVSSFGIGGTNAHVILEEAPPHVPATNQMEPTHHLLTLSAKNEPALREMAADYSAFLATQPTTDLLGNICYTAHVGRSHFAHRLSLVGASPKALQEKLHIYLAGDEAVGSSQGVVANNHTAPQVAFLFTGQGSQYVGMGQELYETQPVFRATIDRCDEILQTCLGRSLLDLIYPATTPHHNDLMESHPCGQATNFAIECALADLWRSWGVEPDFVLGHSLGDFAAAYTAGVLSLEDGLRLVTERGRLMETALGSMVAVRGSEAEILPFLKAADSVTIGVINGPRSVVISGEDHQVSVVNRQLQAAGFQTRKLAIPVAAHSPMLDPVLDDFAQAVGRLVLSPPTLPVVSSMTGQLVQDELTDPNYWRNHLRDTVRFADGVQTLWDQGCTIFIEIGPQPTLLGITEQIENEGMVTLPSLRENQSDWQQMLTSLAALYTHGVPIDWHGFDQPYQRHKVQLPTYPFQRQRYWIDAPRKKAKVDDSAENRLKPLIDKMIHTPVSNTTIFETLFSADARPNLADYRISDTAVVPVATQLALLFEAAGLALDGRSPALENLAFPDPLVIPEQGRRTVQLLATASAANPDLLDLKLVGFDSNEKKPTIVTAATGQLSTAANVDSNQFANLDSYRKRCTNEVDSAQIYPNGIAVGASLRWLADAWRGEGELFGKLTMPDGIDNGDSYQVHPGLLESCLALVAACQPETAVPLLPATIDRAKLYQPVQMHNNSEWWCYGRQLNKTTWDIQLFDQYGSCLIEMEGVEYAPAPLDVIYRQSDAWRRWLYATHWEPMATGQHNGFHLVEEKASLQGQTWLIFADAQGACEALVPSVHINGHNVASQHNAILVYPGDAFQQLEQNCFTIRPKHPDDYRQLIAALPAVTDVVHCWSLDAPAVEEASQLTWAAELSCETALYVTQALLHERLSPPRLWLVTQGTQATNRRERVAGFAQSALWGMGRTIGLEHPELNCVCIDLDESAELVAQMPDLYRAMVENQTSRENQIALRQGIKYVQRLNRYKHAPAKMAIHKNATYLITGGLGKIGLEIACWFVEQGATQLILLGRNRPNAATQAKVDAMRTLGAQVHVAQADVSDEAQLTAVLTHIPPAYPLRGIVHAAGVLDDAALLQQSWQSFEKVFTPKVQGTWLLHSLTQHIPLDFFVLFSSAAGLLGNAGQANHAAANTFMDGLAHYRHTMGLPTLSINWQGWQTANMAVKVRPRAKGNRLPSRVFGAYAPQQGVQAFANLLGQSVAQVACMSINWHRYFDDPTRAIPFYTTLAQETAMEMDGQSQQVASIQPRSSTPSVSIHDQLLQLSPPERRPLLTQTIQGEVARLLGIGSPEKVAMQDGLISLGMDSLMSIELRNRVQQLLKVKLPVAKFLEDISLMETIDSLLDQFNHNVEQNTPLDDDEQALDATPIHPQSDSAKVKEILL